MTEYKLTGIIVSQQERDILMKEWAIHQSVRLLTEKAWVIGNVSFDEYLDSIIFQKFYVMLWTIAIREGFTDRSKSLFLIPRTRQIAYPI